MRKIAWGLASVAIFALVGTVSFKPLARGVVEWYSRGAEVARLIEQDKSISTLTTNLWGKHTVLLTDRTTSATQISQTVRIDADPDVEGELTNRLKLEVVRFVQAYSDGSFEAIRDFYLSSNSFVISNVVMNKLRWQRANPPKIQKLGEYSVTTRERVAELEAEGRENPVPVPYDATCEANLRELYTNILIATLSRHVMMEGLYATNSPNSSWLESITDFNNGRAYERIQSHIENVCAAMDKSTDMKEYVVPWESLSLDLLQVRVFAGTANAPPNVFQANSALLDGVQFAKPIWTSYQLTPDQICKRDGYVWFGVFQTAVKPKGDAYYCPLTVCFYYNPQDSQWRICALASHSFLAQSIPL